jgi:serine/threonine-protein kinase RsbT
VSTLNDNATPAEITVEASQSMALQSQEDVVRLRQTARDLAAAAGLSLVEQTKLITAASELARNTVLHGGGGHATLSQLRRLGRAGLRMVFEDHGPGIADRELAMRDGYTTGNGLGLGLSGSKRLCDEFELWSEPGVGTRVSITQWKR